MACVFFRIVEGPSPASWAFEDDRVIAFMDIAGNPWASIGRAQVPHTVLGRPPSRGGGSDVRGGAIWHRPLRRSSIAAEGVNLFLADGKAPIQEVPHTDLHVILRTRGDGFTITAGFGCPERDVVDSQAAAIRAVIEPNT